MGKQRVALFLTFNGTAGEAMNFYASSLPSAKITKLARYGKDHPFAEGNEDRIYMGRCRF